MNGPSEPVEEHGRSFWIGLAVGSALMLWGAWLYLDVTPDGRRRVSFASWIIGLDVAHDLALAPAVVAIGLIVVRFVPRRMRAVVQAGLIASAFVLTVGILPLVGTYSGDNPTIQPIAYGPAVLIVLGLIWSAVGLAVVVRRGRPAPGRVDQH